MAVEKILIVDDDESILFSMKRVFEKEGFKTRMTSSGNEVLDIISGDNPSLIFMDVAMPDMSGLEILEQINQKEIDIPVVIMTGFGSMQTAIKAVQLGAYDYITKPLDLNKVRSITRRAIETVHLRDEIESLRMKLDHNILPEDRFEIIGNDPKMQEIFKTIGTITKTPNTTTVLITGESGTGKELVARAIHNSGQSRDKPFIAVNCTVFPDNLLESELFGHEKGSFTGATDRRLGKFEVAGGGMIFLDEIGDVPQMLQKKLLRVLQEREFERVGGNELIPVEARFVASTNRILDEDVARGTFREDLFYRLNVISINLPPLREKVEDIPLLSEHFLRKYNRRFGKSIHGISNEVMEILQAYPFPGNIRELENTIERSVAMEQGDMILPHSLPKILLRNMEEKEDKVPITSFVLDEARNDVMQMFERKYVVELLKSTRGNVSRAAEKALVDRRTIQRMMKKYGIVAKDYGDRNPDG